MKRILYVENDRGIVAGSIRALHQLIKHLDRERYEPWVALSRRNPMLPDFEKLDCRIVALARDPMPAALIGGHGLERVQRLALYRLKSLANDLARSREIAGVIRAHGIDLVHANNNLHSSRHAIWAAVRCRVPVVCHQRTQYRGSLGGSLSSRFVRESLCISRTIHDTLTGGGARPGGLRIVYDGVEVPQARPPRPAIGAEPRIAIVGRVTEWKGQHVLIRAAPRVLARIPGARFLIAGSADDAESRIYERNLEALARELGVEKSVEFLGHVDDVERFMRERADVIVHASITPEPFGLVVAEAMAAGTPIVASNSGACPEIVEHGRSGLLFEPGEPDALAEALLRLLSEPELPEALSSQGWTRVQARFQAPRTTREVEEVYHEILGC